MSLLDVFVTYLAVGSAFAMRGYFLNRRRPVWSRVRIVLTQFFLWLPIWLFRLTRATPNRRLSSASSGIDPKIEAQIEDLLLSFPGIRVRKQVRQALERYAALHAALDDEIGRASGQFELFSISGNGNGASGSPCLYRKNLSKIRAHKIRTADDLLRVIHQHTELKALDSQLAAFFDAFGDSDSIVKLKALDSKTVVDDSLPVRMAA